MFLTSIAATLSLFRWSFRGSRPPAVLGPPPTRADQSRRILKIIISALQRVIVQSILADSPGFIAAAPRWSDGTIYLVHH